MQKVITNLWFDSNAEAAARFYTSLVPGSEIQNIDYYGRAGAAVSGQPEGSVLTVDFTLQGQTFVAINGGPVFKFTPAVSLMITCETQQEADTLWEALSADGGEKGQCGWLTDKYGLSWQIVPVELLALVHDPDPQRAERATAAMLKMTRLDVAQIKRAMEQA